MSKVKHMIEFNAFSRVGYSWRLLYRESTYSEAVDSRTLT